MCLSWAKFRFFVNFSFRLKYNQYATRRVLCAYYIPFIVRVCVRRQLFEYYLKHTHE